MALLHALGRVCRFVLRCKNLYRIGPRYCTQNLDMPHLVLNKNLNPCDNLKKVASFEFLQLPSTISRSTMMYFFTVKVYDGNIQNRHCSQRQIFFDRMQNCITPNQFLWWIANCYFKNSCTNSGYFGVLSILMIGSGIENIIRASFAQEQ